MPGNPELWRLRVSDRTAVLVDPAFGNVLIELQAFVMNGTGQRLSIAHVYNNSASELGVLGPGWTTSVGADIGLEIADGAVTLSGERGHRFRFVADGSGGYLPPPGANAVLCKQSDGSYTVDFARSGQRWSFTAHGWFVAQSDRNGNANKFHYGLDGVLAAVVDSQGRYTIVLSDADGRMTKIIDPAGRDVAHYRYRASGELTAIVDPAGNTTDLWWDPAGNLGSITDPAGRAYEFGYDGHGRVTAVSAPRSAGPVITTFAYGDGETVKTDPNGNVTRYRFDADNRLAEVTDPLEHTQRQTWTANGDLSARIDGLNNTTSRGYDHANNLASRTLPTGDKACVEYRDSAHPHLPTKVTDPVGNTVTYQYDSSGNLTKAHSVGLNTDIDTRTYNANGTLATATDGNGHETSYGYDAAGNLTSVTPPAPLGTTRYKYDALSRGVQTISGSGHRIGFHYDSCDRLVSVTDDDTDTTLLSLQYDPLGNVIRRAGPRWAVHFTWDGHLLTSAERVDEDGAERVTYSYDLAGNLVTITDAAGMTRYDYDAADRLTALTDPFGRTTRFGYDAADRRTSVTYPGGATQAIGYDGAGRQTAITVTNSAGVTVLEVGYGYADALTSMVVDGVTTTYGYDGLNRLIRAGASVFGYDHANNLIDLSGSALTVNAANQHVRFNATTLHYDGAGNFTSELDPTGEFTYSSTNQLLTGVFGGLRVVDFSYDGIDNTMPRRIVETTLDGATVTHVLGHSAIGLTQVVDDGVRSSYIRAPDGGLVTMRAGNGNLYDLITDYQGSVLALLDSDGNVAGRYTYTPFGAVSASGPAAGDNVFRYRGAYQLLRGAHMMGHRVYNGFWGRFTQSDPTDRERNAYTFAANDPLNAGNATRTSFWPTLTCRPENIAGTFLSTGRFYEEKNDRLEQR